MTSSARKLTAILAADVAGYSRLMGADEEGTLARLKTHRRELIDPKIAEHRGRIVKTTGDGMLVEFASVVDAVKCAVEIQRAMRERETDLAADKLIQFRIGVNVGDILIDGEDIHGDGVNVAARLEALAEPGTICLSGGAWDQARRKIAVSAEDLGEKRLKNIERPVRVYRIAPEAAPSERPALPLPDKPSIAVLPFQNMSSDPEQEYFADGMVEEIITGLSRIRWLFVIARNSSFTYKGKSVDVKQVGRDLGVRYVLEGSVRKAGPKVRITAQLIDAGENTHIWADRFDGTLDDIFELQDQVTASVVGVLGPKLQQADIERANRKPTSNLDAYDLYLRGRSLFPQTTAAETRRAYELAKKAAGMDPSFASAHMLMAHCQHFTSLSGFEPIEGDPGKESVRLARLALRCDPSDTEIQSLVGFLLAYHEGDAATGLALAEKAMSLTLNSAQSRGWAGWTFLIVGDPVRARDLFQQAIRLSPSDPMIGVLLRGLGATYVFERRLDEALPVLKAATQGADQVATCLWLATTLAHLGRMDEARAAVGETLRLSPKTTISSARLPYQSKEFVTFLREGLRMAGLPE